MTLFLALPRILPLKATLIDAENTGITTTAGAGDGTRSLIEDRALIPGTSLDVRNRTTVGGSRAIVGRNDHHLKQEAQVRIFRSVTTQYFSSGETRPKTKSRKLFGSSPSNITLIRTAILEPPKASDGSS
jgi:hypothetical protein